MSTMLDLKTEPVADPHRASARSWQARLLVAGGVVFAVGNALHPLEHSEAAYDAGTWQAAHLVILASIPMLVLGLPAVHRALDRALPYRLDVLPLVAVMVGLIGIAPGTVIEAFVAPRIGHAAMEELAAGGMGVVDAVFGVAFLGGSLGLGWAIRRSRLRPAWTGSALMATSVVLLASMGLTGPVGGIVIIAATIVYGSILATLGTRV